MRPAATRRRPAAVSTSDQVLVSALTRSLQRRRSRAGDALLPTWDQSAVGQSGFRPVEQVTRPSGRYTVRLRSGQASWVSPCLVRCGRRVIDSYRCWCRGKCASVAGIDELACERGVRGGQDHHHARRATLFLAQAGARQPLFALLAYTGLRIGEALGPTWADI